MKHTELLAILGLKLEEISTYNLYEQVKKIETMKLYENLKVNGEYINGGYEYHYEGDTPYVHCICTNWDEDEDVKVFAIRMTAPTMLEVECAPISDPDFRMTITANDIDYGQIEFLTI